MKSALILVALASAAFAQSAARKSATVPITLDHNRIIIDVYLPLPNGNTKRVRGWVDNGNPDLWITENATKLMGLEVTGEAREVMGSKVRTAPAPKEILVGDMPVSFSGIKEARVALGDSIGPGTSAQINLPATVLRKYDLLVNYPDREFTIANTGTVQFQGVRNKAFINSENGVMQISGKIEGKEHNLGLDLGAPVGFLTADLADKLLHAHSKWPHMTGAVGIANLWGLEDEPRWQLLRLPSLQFGPVVLTDIVFASVPKETMEFLENRAGTSTSGLLGANALLNYRVGLDYAHSAVYFDISRTYKAPDMDVIGLILRPEPNERYTVLGVVDYDGKPSVPEVKKGDVLISVDGIRATGGTMGQVCSSLEGSPGKVRTLTLERDGKQFEVQATVQRFLSAEAPRPASSKNTK